VRLFQAAIEKDKNVEGGASEDGGKRESVEELSSQVNELSMEDSTQQAQDVDKKIRALKKKVRNLCFYSPLSFQTLPAFSVKASNKIHCLCF